MWVLCQKAIQCYFALKKDSTTYPYSIFFAKRTLHCIYNTINLKKKRSKRHHYIPKFLIKEFTDEQGLLYIYDKIKDKFLTNKRSPKSIFFENDRNTIVYDESKKT